MVPIEKVLLIVGVLLITAVLTSKASSRLGVPALLLFLVLGMLAGSEGPGGIPFDNALVAQAVGVVALAFILFSGGLETDRSSISPVLWSGLSLSTLGVLATALVELTFSLVLTPLMLSAQALFVLGENIVRSYPDPQAVRAALEAAQFVVVSDLFMTDTAELADVVLPAAAPQEKDGTYTNVERRVQRLHETLEAPGEAQPDWKTLTALAQLMGAQGFDYRHPSQIMDEIARLTPTFAGVSYEKLDRLGSIQWPCTDEAPEGTPIMHVDEFVRGKGRFVVTSFVPTTERSTRKYPLILTTGRILSQYNVGAQTRRTPNVFWHAEDVLEIHPHDAEVRGIVDGDEVTITSRTGETMLRAVEAAWQRPTLEAPRSER